MRIIRWLKNLFGLSMPPAPGTWFPEDVDDPDPIRRQMIAHVMNTGKAAVGEVQEDGTLKIKDLE